MNTKKEKKRRKKRERKKKKRERRRREKEKEKMTKKGRRETCPAVEDILEREKEGAGEKWLSHGVTIISTKIP